MNESKHSTNYIHDSAKTSDLVPNSQSLIPFLLHLADSNLILSQRNSEWCGHGPVLEQDIAITNISLDLLGQARYFYQYAASLMGHNTTEDSLAYLRTEREFKNVLLVELPKGDWAITVLRQFFYSNYQSLLYAHLKNSKNDHIAAIAEKSLKEVTYHLRWSSEWVIRLGDGTDESRRRIQHAVEELWPYTGELFMPADYEMECAKAGTGVDIAGLKLQWLKNVEEIFSEATLSIPAASFSHTGGKTGRHTEHLGYILTELQYMQRTYPGVEW